MGRTWHQAQRRGGYHGASDELNAEMDPRVKEFHCIMPIANVSSVLEHGILSYARAAALVHRSVAMLPVQDRRDKKCVPGGHMLHEYANLYFHARNPMMFARQEEASRLCVLQVSLDVLKVRGVVLADRNAASDWVRFLQPSQSALLDLDRIYAIDWRDPNRFTFYDKKQKKCAEVLVPAVVEPRFLVGAYVMDRAAAASLVALGFTLPVTIEPVLFFR